MNDIFVDWGTDLAAGSTGDLALATGSRMTNQRVYRRLLTNAGDYIWHLDYGGGLAQFVGTPAEPSDIESVIRTQMCFETSVATSPAPRVTANVVDAANGYVVASITYADASSGTPVQLDVSSG